MKRERFFKEVLDPEPLVAIEPSKWLMPAGWFVVGIFFFAVITIIVLSKQIWTDYKERESRTRIEEAEKATYPIGHVIETQPTPKKKEKK